MLALAIAFPYGYPINERVQLKPVSNGGAMSEIVMQDIPSSEGMLDHNPAGPSGSVALPDELDGSSQDLAGPVSV